MIGDDLKKYVKNFIIFITGYLLMTLPETEPQPLNIFKIIYGARNSNILDIERYIMNFLRFFGLIVVLYSLVMTTITAIFQFIKSKK